MVVETITFRIILEHPVPGIIYGLQSGSGHRYEVLQKQVAQSGELIFDTATCDSGDMYPVKVALIFIRIGKPLGSNKV